MFYIYVYVKHISEIAFYRCPSCSAEKDTK